MGTPAFAVPSLIRLKEDGHNICAVLTQPDRPQGRGKKVHYSPIKALALEWEVPLLQYESLKDPDAVEALASFKADLFVTCAYGLILPQDILDIPRLGTLNVHASLLPKYRGAAPIQWSIIRGESMSGVTTMLTDAGMDTGPILLKSDVPITIQMNSGELAELISLEGARLISVTIDQYVAGKIKPVPQEDAYASKAPVIKKSLGALDFNDSAEAICNLIRGVTPVPGAYTGYKGLTMKVWKARLHQKHASFGKPGEIVSVSKDGLLIACGSGALWIDEVQFPSSRKMCMAEYLCGHSMRAGEVLGIQTPSPDEEHYGD
jgi:methionyl-tRNA formyltransferase